MESCYQRSVKFAYQEVLLSVLVCFFVSTFIWYRMHLHWSHLKNLMFKFYKTIVLRLKLLFYIKNTLKQVWKSPTVFVVIWKQYAKNFAFLILRILKLFAREVYEFLKKYANFYLILFFAHFFLFLFFFFCNSSHISSAPISKRERCFNAKSLTYYFHVKTKVLGFHQKANIREQGDKEIMSLQIFTSHINLF